MIDGSVGEFDELTPAWREFEAHTPVKLRAIENERHFRDMVKFMDKLGDRIGDQENHPLMGLLDIVTAFVHDYEELNVEIPDASPSAILRFLMDQHGLHQADLADEFGSQLNVSKVINGKREINARQASALRKRFGVSPGIFI
jgi:HTH-type transcriptional regulator/antitoxin HigA